MARSIRAKAGAGLSNNGMPEPPANLRARHRLYGAANLLREQSLLEQACEATVKRDGDTAPDLPPLLNKLAQLYLESGDLKKASQCAERALALSETLFGPDSIELAAPLDTLARCCFAFGHLDRCYRAGERALTILQRMLGDDHVEAAMARDRLAVVLAEMGSYQRAKELHRSALALLRGSGRQREFANVLANTAATCLAAGDLEEVRQLHDEALASVNTQMGDRHDGAVTYLTLLGDYWSKAGDCERALHDYREALALRRENSGELHPQVAQLLFKIGRAQYQSDPNAGRETVLQAIAIVDIRCLRPHLFAEIFSFLATLSPLPAASIFFRKLAVNDIASMRAHVARLDAVLERSFLAHNRDDFRALGEALITCGRLPEAQKVLAMIKEHELFSLTRLDARTTNVPLTSLEAQWVRRGWRLLTGQRALLEAESRAPTKSGKRRREKLRMKIAQTGRDLGRALDQLVAEFAAVERRKSPDASGLRSVEATNSLGRQIPESGTALLQYMLTPDHSAMSIILTTSHLQREFRIAWAEGEVNRLVYAVRNSIQHRSDLFLPSAQRLYAMLIGPMLETLRAAQVTTLAFSLDGVLRYLPMAALHSGNCYLIEQFGLIEITHPAATPPAISAARRAVGLGVTRPVEGHQPLFGVRDELAAVIRTPGKRVGVLPGIIRVDDRFTAEELARALSARYSVIHIASHFVFTAARETSSYLLLGDGSRLTLAQFAELRFDGFDLVVLSACNTAISGGHHQNGREIEGLGALVRHQGAREVVATLWPVVDLTTAAFMRGFYRNRYEHKLAAAESLRHAQLDLLHGRMADSPQSPTRSLSDPDDDQADGSQALDTRHPFYWAPYVLMGALADRPTL